MDYVPPKCSAPTTKLGRWWLAFKIKFLMRDDGESLICPNCGQRYWVG